MLLENDDVQRRLSDASLAEFAGRMSNFTLSCVLTASDNATDLSCLMMRLLEQDHISPNTTKRYNTTFSELERKGLVVSLDPSMKTRSKKAYALTLDGLRLQELIVDEVTKRVIEIARLEELASQRSIVPTA